MQACLSQAPRLAEMSWVMRADLAAGQAWEGGLYQSVDLRPLLGRITSPTLIVAGELDFICGPAQAQPIAAAVTGSRLVMLAGCGHIPGFRRNGTLTCTLMHAAMRDARRSAGW